MPRANRSRSGRERTPAERERDRLERERKRAGGAPEVPETPATPEAPAPETPTASLPGAGLDPPTFVEAPEPAQEPPDFVGAPPPVQEPPVQEPPDLVEAPEPVQEQTVDPAPAPAPVPPAAPAPPAAPPPPQGSAEAGGPPPPAREPRRRHPWLARLAAVVALAAVAVAVVVVLRAHDGKHAETPPAAPVVKVLIPEGKTRLQIAQIAAADGLKGDYRRASRASPLLKPSAYGAPARTPDLEGFLFPATYDMDRAAPVDKLVEEQLIAFHEHFGTAQIAAARRLHVSPYQLLTVASMVEREAVIPSDRAKIAAVIYNRLSAGMPLGIDATIYYAVELERNIPTYTRELDEAQLHIDSPYNTRTHLGLPPTPISNPGQASIEAAAHPAHVAYLYYVAGADGCGEMVFSDTQEQFETDAAAYREAQARNGGRPPVCKRRK